MQVPEDFTLRNCDHEDIDEIILSLTRSFNVPVNDMANVVTLGDLTTLLQQYGNNHHTGDCTTQQAFYKVRNALKKVDDNNAVIVTPATPLQTLITRKYLRKKVELFQQELGINIDMLRIKSGPENIILLLGFAAFVCSFISLTFAGMLLLACTVTHIASKYLFVELTPITAGKLAEKITKQHYLLARRHTGTINRQEIFKLVQHIFSERLALDKAVLTQDAVLYQ